MLRRPICRTLAEKPTMNLLWMMLLISTKGRTAVITRVSCHLQHNTAIACRHAKLSFFQNPALTAFGLQELCTIMQCFMQQDLGTVDV